MDRGQQEFLKLVVNPALARPRGLPRLKALFVDWLGWTESADLPGGCPMIGGAIEFDDKPGIVRDALVTGQRAWIDTLTRATRQAIEQGQLRAASCAPHHPLTKGVAMPMSHVTHDLHRISTNVRFLTGSLLLLEGFASRPSTDREAGQFAAGSSARPSFRS